METTGIARPGGWDPGPLENPKSHHVRSHASAVAVETCNQAQKCSQVPSALFPKDLEMPESRKVLNWAGRTPENTCPKPKSSKTVKP